MKEFDLNQLISLCKRRGFIFQDSEIYGGINGFWDYGPLGVELKRNIRSMWWKEMVEKRGNVVGMDSSIINHPRAWEASGHVESFTDPMVDCKVCKKRYRGDEVESDKCPACGGELTEARQFNLMFRTFVGANVDSSSEAFLRPETAQAIFVNFKNVQETSRQKIPFGIAQTGKSFRNEINPRNFIFRSREFEQMEMEFFVHPDERKKWFEYWVEQRVEWYTKIGIKRENLKLREHEKEELAHYSDGTVDIEYYFPFGWQELEGIADRGDFDLSRHIEFSGKDLSYFDPFTQEKFTPNVIETSAGLDRTLLTVLADAYEEEQLENDSRTVLRLSPAVAPIQVAVFPLHKKLKENAEKLEEDLRLSGFKTFYDDKGAIGRLYRRQDEAGTPYCLTFDFDSLEDNAVTVRDRDSMEQERINISQIKEFLSKKFGA
ncbi:MAG: glycine--tRNA ligase [Acidobacteria bacterium]|nr:glycine--tRNA ligase [Acidobacteriota bacterium]